VRMEERAWLILLPKSFNTISFYSILRCVEVYITAHKAVDSNDTDTGGLIMAAALDGT